MPLPQLTTIAKVGIWIHDNLPTFTAAAKKVARFVHNSAESLEKWHKGGQDIINGKDLNRDPSSKSDVRSSMPQKIKRPSLSRDRAQSNEIEVLQTSLEERKKAFDRHELADKNEHNRLKVEIDILELIISAQTLGRFISNLRIHQSNLEIHRQTIQNTCGMLDDINVQRLAIQRMLTAMNQVTDRLDMPRLEKFDLKMKPGAVSVKNAVTAFEETQLHLREEVKNLIEFTESQKEAADRVRATASKVEPLRKSVNDWLSDSVEPTIKSILGEATTLLEDLEMMPRLQSNIRTELNR